MSEPIIFTDRYDVCGPPNGCKGPCEGTGVVPVYVSRGDVGVPQKRLVSLRPVRIEAVRPADEGDPVLRALWEHEQALTPTEDGWHFVPCPTCAARVEERP